MIPINEALETGAWLRAKFRPDGSLESDASNGDSVLFQFRVVDFSKIDLSSVDQCEKLSVGLDSNIWKLGLDVVNLGKRELPIQVVSARLFIADDEGYEFQMFDDHHLRIYSDFSTHSGLQAFFSLSLPPKIKRRGALPYELSDDFEQGFLTIRGGTLQEA